MNPTRVSQEQELLLTNCGVRNPSHYALFCELPQFGDVYAEARRWGLLSSFFYPTRQSAVDAHFRLIKGDAYTGIIRYDNTTGFYQFFAPLHLDRTSCPTSSAGVVNQRLSNQDLEKRCGLPPDRYDLVEECNLILEDVLKAAFRHGLQPGSFVTSKEPGPFGALVPSTTNAHFRFFNNGRYCAVITSEGTIPTYRLYVPH